MINDKTKTIQRVVIFANGQYSAPKYYKETIQPEDYLICADGGANAAFSMGFIPDEIIGDFDSADAEILKKLDLEKTIYSQYPSAKNESDLELAIEKSISLSPDLIMIFGAMGKRTDHFLINVMLLNRILRGNIKAVMSDQTYDVFLIDDAIALQTEKDMKLTLIPLSDVVKNVETQGLRYALNKEDLYAGSSRGLSNEALGNRVTINLSEGRLLVIVIKK